jgi:ribosomal protein S18 acetylase RimI-like enzyme
MFDYLKRSRFFLRFYHHLNALRSKKALFKALRIRLIAETELSYLDHIFESEYPRSHADDLEDQSLGKVSFCIAWIGSHAIGHILVKWAGPRADLVKQEFPNCPEIYRLEVLKPYRSIGIGRLLINIVCEEATEKGFEMIGLGVDDLNLRASSLYQRLSFVQSSVNHYIDEYQQLNEAGEVVKVAESGTWLIKTL